MYHELKLGLLKQIITSISALAGYYEAKVSDRSYDNIFLRTMVFMIEEYMSQNPLTEEDIQQIRDTLAQIPAAKQALYDAKRAGTDITQFEKELLETETKLRNILTVYGNKK